MGSDAGMIRPSHVREATDVDESALRSSHIREAATPQTPSEPSSVGHSIQLEPPTPALVSAFSTPSPLPSPPAHAPSTPPRSSARSSYDDTTPSRPKRASLSPSDSGRSWRSGEHSRSGGEGTPMSIKRALTRLRRASAALPRAPSRASLTLSSPPRTPPRVSMSSVISSPPLPALPPPPTRIIAPWPDALQFKDITNRKSSLERSIGYAQKINELYQYDCGLTHWIVNTTVTRGLFSA
jgi:hypothetical protein